MSCFYKFVFVLSMLIIALSVSSSLAESTQNDDNEAEQEEDYLPIPETDEAGPTSLRGVGRFLAQKSTRAMLMKCDKNPKICHLKGSPGHYCCKKKCVSYAKDRLNCGKCGHKCKYSEICCKGKCVNPLSDKKHCGGCNTKCRKGSKCVYGMCSYA
ncbi:hypothetical protein ABFX02_13G126600 [Erythranthe guttata]